jgi:hypothetical protein
MGADRARSRDTALQSLDLGVTLKFLLTSGGVTNPSIRGALVDLLGKPIAESDALCIPTAEYGHPACTPASAWRFISGHASSSMCGLGWKSLGVLELTALPSIGEERWVPWVREADVLLVDGGDAGYLCHELMPDNTMDAAQRWAAGLEGPAYAIDDETAITVNDGTAEVVSEGSWRHFPW